MAKYDSLRKIERNRMLYQYHLAHPELSYEEVGKAFNVSRQTAHHIEKAEKKRILAEAVTKGELWSVGHYQRLK